MSSKELASRQDGAHDVVVLDVTEGDMEAASPKRERCLYDDVDFRAFWTIYPRHENKKGAFRSWKKALEAGLRAEDILREATDYRELVAAENRDLRYVKHPTTFLNQLDADSIGDARKSMSDAAQFEREKEYMASTQRQRGMSMSQYSAEEEAKAVRRQLETYPVLTTQDIDSAARDLGFMLEDIPQHADMISGLDKIKTTLEEVVPKMTSLVEAYNAYVASTTMEELARTSHALQAVCAQTTSVIFHNACRYGWYKTFHNVHAIPKAIIIQAARGGMNLEDARRQAALAALDDVKLLSGKINHSAVASVLTEALSHVETGSDVDAAINNTLSYLRPQQDYSPQEQAVFAKEIYTKVRPAPDMLELDKQQTKLLVESR